MHVLVSIGICFWHGIKLFLETTSWFSWSKRENGKRLTARQISETCMHVVIAAAETMVFTTIKSSLLASHICRRRRRRRKMGKRYVLKCSGMYVRIVCVCDCVDLLSIRLSIYISCWFGGGSGVGSNVPFACPCHSVYDLRHPMKDCPFALSGCRSSIYVYIFSCVRCWQRKRKQSKKQHTYTRALKGLWLSEKRKLVELEFLWAWQKKRENLSTKQLFSVSFFYFLSTHLYQQHSFSLDDCHDDDDVLGDL